MSQELHAADAYKAGGGNLFVAFGEPDIALARDAAGDCAVRLRGVEEAWATLYATQSRPFPPPRSGRIAVKVINHYGNEAVRVFEVT